jgi:hypothetical protein
MGGKIPREIKERVIREWLQGIKREKIAENNDLQQVVFRIRQLAGRVS